MRGLRNLRIIVGALTVLVMVGSAGFHFIEGWTWFDSFYMVLTTVTSIGYGEIHPLSHAGRVFNIYTAPPPSPCASAWPCPSRVSAPL